MRLRSVNGTATTTSTAYELLSDKVKFIANDDATNDLWVAFNEDIEDSSGVGNYLVVKAGETFTAFDELRAKTIWVKSSASTVAFRVVGVKD
jgi:hypothetical protein